MIITYTAHYTYTRARGLSERGSARRRDDPRSPPPAPDTHAHRPDRARGPTAPPGPDDRAPGRAEGVIQSRPPPPPFTRFVPCHTSARRERGDPRSPSLTSLH